MVNVLPIGHKQECNLMFKHTKYITMHLVSLFLDEICACNSGATSGSLSYVCLDVSISTCPEGKD